MDLKGKKIEKYLYPQKDILSKRAMQSTIISSSEDKWHIEPCDLDGQILHCLIPRKYRQQLDFIISANIPDDIAKKSIITMIEQESIYKNYQLEILSVEQISNDENDDENDNLYKVILIGIPNEIISKMLSNNMRSCIFYIGFSENIKEFTFLSEAPLDKKIAMTDREGNAILYKTGLLEF